MTRSNTLCINSALGPKQQKAGKKIGMKPDTPFILGQFNIVPIECSITTPSGDQQVLQPKFIDVLCCLASHYPNLVSREVLIDTLWDGNYPVGEKALTNAIWNLRQQLKDQDTQYIETVRKRGYRLLLAPEYPSEDSTPPSPTPTIAAVTGLKHQWTTPVVFATLLLLLVTSVILNLFHGNTSDNTPLAPVTTNPHNVQLSKLTTDPGREFFPVVSPDGRYLVYVWRRIGQHSNLYIKDLSQTDLQPRQLTFTDQVETRPVWSLDGLQLYFVQKSWDREHCNIMSLTLATNEQHPLTGCPPQHNISLSLSHDGKTLGFIGNSDNKGGSYANTGIYFFDLTQPQRKPVRFSCGDECKQKDRNFAFSPDGKTIAVSRRVESLIEDIFLVDLQSKKSRQLTFGEGDIIGLAWHPKGDRLIYATVNSDAREGYVININDGDIRSLNLPGFSFPSFIPGTESLVYHDWRIRTHIAYLQLSQPILATPFPVIQSEFNHRNPHYSASANRLVYVSNESGFNEIWTSEVNGTKRQKLTTMTTNLSSPRWSHDGQHIAFIGPEKDRQRNNLYVLNVKTRQVQKLISPFDEHHRPTWLADNSAVISVATDNNSSRLYTFALNAVDGQKPAQLLNDTASYAIQTTDNTIWYTKDTGQGLWRLTPGQTPVQVLNGDAFAVRFNWMVTDKGVYYQHNHTDHQRINFYRFADKQLSSLVKVPQETLDRSGSMTYITSAEQIVFDQSEYPQVDVQKLVHFLLE